ECVKILDSSAEGPRLDTVQGIHPIRPGKVVVGDIPVPKADLTGIQGEAQPLFALLKRAFSCAPLGDIAKYQNGPDGFRLRITDWRAAVIDGALGPFARDQHVVVGRSHDGALAQRLGRGIFYRG